MIKEFLFHIQEGKICRFIPENFHGFSLKKDFFPQKSHRIVCP